MEDGELEVLDADLELEDNFEKIGELMKVDKRTPEQEESLKDLKNERKNLSKQRIGELTKKARQAEAKAEEKEEELRQLRAEREQFKQKEQPSAGKYEQITVNGKKFYTDEALGQMVQDGKMTQTEAWKQQRDVIKEEAKEEFYNEQKQFSNKNKDEEIRQETINDVLKEYPHFNPKHKDHDPEDPLYKEASRILNNGYLANPRGIKLAIEDAKRILGRDLKRPDLSDELSIQSGGGGAPESRKGKEVTLSEFETQQAVRLYMYGGKQNPVTGKAYTQKEAIEKALKAKRDRNR